MEEEYSNLLNQSTKDKIEKFINFHFEKQTKIVLITSGGTTVPLEENTVRFIDNFSIGTRGSASAEYFLENSYAVLFLYRKRSLKPFERKLNNVNPFDLVKPGLSYNSYEIDQSLINFDFEEVLNDYNQIQSKNLLLNIEYTTLFDYLSALQFCCKKLDCFGPHALIYLAAAVSDFYIPKNELSKHKIQSNHAGLDLSLKPVPKLVGKLKSEWCNEAYVVTFKLETDPDILMSKCKKSLENYRHHVVIGNILESRKHFVTVLQSNGACDEISLAMEEKSLEIEELIVNFLVNLHLSFISK